MYNEPNGFLIGSTVVAIVGCENGAGQQMFPGEHTYPRAQRVFRHAPAGDPPFAHTSTHSVKFGNKNITDF